MFGELVPLGGGDPIPLLKERLMVGRSDSCDIVLSFPNVSSHHTELEFLGGYWQARNLSSSNGTKVNGERIDERFLQPGDTICFAKHCFEVQYTLAANAAPPPVREDNPFSKSLLERAGLAPRDRGRPPSERPSHRPPPPKPVPPRRPEEMDENDKALEWLMGETPPPDNKK